MISAQTFQQISNAFAFCYIFLYIYIHEITQAHIHVLEVKSTITRYVKCFIPGISTSKNLFKEIESANSNAPGRSTSFKQMLVG